MEKTLRHAIEEEEKVPVEQVTNFEEVTVREAGRASPCLVPSSQTASFSSTFIVHLLRVMLWTDDTGSLVGQGSHGCDV